MGVPAETAGVARSRATSRRADVASGLRDSAGDEGESALGQRGGNTELGGDLWRAAIAWATGPASKVSTDRRQTDDAFQDGRLKMWDRLAPVSGFLIVAPSAGEIVRTEGEASTTPKFCPVLGLPKV